MLLSKRHNFFFLEIFQKATGEKSVGWFSLSYSLTLFEHLTLGRTRMRKGTEGGQEVREGGQLEIE